ncbi:MAG: hypothetical protein ACRDLF_08770 [Solirubrobacteraceae bacterium]
MTPKAPSFDQIEQFLKAHRWTEVTGRSGHGAGHRVFEKVLAGGEVLTTHISHSGKKGPGTGRFGEMLREQLKTNRKDFWKAIETGEPVPRPAPIEAAVAAPEAWQVEVLLRRVGVKPEELQGMTTDQARQIIEKHWAES